MDEDLNQKSLDELKQIKDNLAEENTNLKNETQDSDEKQKLLERIVTLQKENEDLRQRKEMTEKDVSSVFDLTLAQGLGSVSEIANKKP